MEDMRKIWVIAGIAVALAVATAYIALALSPSNATTTGARWVDRAPHWSVPAAQGPTWSGAMAEQWAAHPRGPFNRGDRWPISAPPTAENLTVSMSSDQVSLQLKLTGITRGSSDVAQIVAGGGSVEAGGQSYNVVSACGVVGSGFFALRLYTGNALIAVVYHNGVYRAVVQPLGIAQMTVYYGNATAQIT